MKTSHIVFAFLIVIFLAIFFTIGAGYHFLYTPVVTDDRGVVYTVRAGSSMKSVTDELHTQNIIQHPYFFSMLVHFRGVTHELKAGEYHFQKNSTPVSILKQIVTGTGLYYHPFMVVPGWNFHQLREALNNEVKLKRLLTNVPDQEIMKRLGFPALKPEGQFFPDTYYYTAGSSDLMLLKRAFTKMQDKMNTAWKRRDANLIYKNAYEALIASSIVEKEAYFKSERPMIAGVLINRLKSDMLLQFDPTVIYGLGANYKGKIRKSDLVLDTPYNTYVHKGLPPTPIAMPSFESINAALHPVRHNYFYFVAKGDGSHHFSQSLTQHYSAVEASKKIHPMYYSRELIKTYFKSTLR